MIGEAELTVAEQRVWEAFPTGEIVDFREGHAEADDVTHAAKWSSERQVRSEVIAALLCGAVNPEAGVAPRIFLRGVRINGRLHLSGLTLIYRLLLEDSWIGDGLDLESSVTPDLSLRRCYLGPIVLARATVNGTLDFRGSTVAPNDETPLSASGLSVSGNLICHSGFHAHDGIDLTGSNIGGHVNFSGSSLGGSGSGVALSADRLKVEENMLCTNAAGHPFHTNGQVRLMWANIGGQLVFRGAQLTAAREQWKTAEITGVKIHLGEPSGNALNAYGLNVAADLLCDGGFTATGHVSLSHANVGVLIDDGGNWPESLDLDGLKYEDLLPYTPAKERLTWLCRSKGYRPQPYEELASHYRRLGYPDQARIVLLAKQRARVKQRPKLTRGWGYLQDGLVGYGYAPGRALLILAAVFVIAWVIFLGYPPAAVDPASHPTFNPALYAIDLLIPAPVLGQPEAWNPHGGILLLALSLRMIGWLLVIAVAAAITRAVSRN
jgi:hypothetical protein